MEIDYRYPISRKEYIGSTFVESATDDWSERTFLSQMIDIWGQANKALKYYKAWKADNDEDSFNSLINELEAVHRICLNIYNNDNIDEREKFEIKTWEWEQYDFYFWDNEFKNTEDTVNRWINQFMFDANLELV